MALPSSRVQDSAGSSVNPDRGIYVDSYGIMEIRTASEDIDFEDHPVDMMDFQGSTEAIPDDFCHKNRSTTEQKFFFCLVCNCDLKNLKPLRDHVKGNKHIRKACEKKREIMGLPKDPQNAPRKKDIKKERPRIDVGMTLQERLEGCGEPAIGLEYITEFSNPRDRKDHRMYTCKLEGCKAAWGTSDDIFNHVKNHKHQKNYFKKMFPDDLRINGWTKDTLLTEAAAYEEKDGGADERDYGLINMVDDYEEYMELRNRPDNWSEKKAQMGIVGDRMNSNMEPLGKSRKRKTSEVVEDSMFDEQSWAGWQPPTLSQVKQDLEADFARGLMDVKDMVEDFNGKKDDEKHKDIQFYQDTYKSLLSFLGTGADLGLENKVNKWNEDLSTINNNLVEKVEAEDRAMKEVAKLMSELEEEIRRYYSQKTTTKHKNIQQRLTELTRKASALSPTSSSNKDMKRKFNDRLTVLFKEFEERSESVVEILEREMDTSSSKPDSEKTRSQKNLELRTAARENYKKDLEQTVSGLLQPYAGKFTNQEEVKFFTSWVVANKFLEPETKAFMQKVLRDPSKSWLEFVVTPETKNSVNKYLIQKMSTYKPGEVYRRAQQQR